MTSIRKTPERVNCISDCGSFIETLKSSVAYNSSTALPARRSSFRFSRSVEPNSNDVLCPARRYEPGLSRTSVIPSSPVVTLSPIWISSPSTTRPLVPDRRITVTLPSTKFTPPALAEMMYWPRLGVFSTWPNALKAEKEPNKPTTNVDSHFLFIYFLLFGKSRFRVYRNSFSIT